MEELKQALARMEERLASAEQALFVYAAGSASTMIRAMSGPPRVS
jgi:hypothetical protein